MIGAGEPALPGISIGHNGTIAFGLTIFNVDQEDLYVYDAQPGRPEPVPLPGRLGDDAHRSTRTSEVKGEAPSARSN